MEAQVSMCRRLLALLLLAAAIAPPSLPQGIFTRRNRVGAATGPRIFSSVRYHKETGDLLGDELVLVILGQKVSATLNDFEGGSHPNQRVLNGTLRDNRLRLYGKNEFGKVRILGTLSGTQLTAVITDRRIGQTPSSRQMQLRLVKKCWFPTCGGPAN